MKIVGVVINSIHLLVKTWLLIININLNMLITNSIANLKKIYFIHVQIDLSLDGSRLTIASTNEYHLVAADSSR